MPPRKNPHVTDAELAAEVEEFIADISSDLEMVRRCVKSTPADLVHSLEYLACTVLHVRSIRKIILAARRTGRNGKNDS